MNAFSEAEIAIIRARYPKEGAAPLIEVLGRPRRSIIAKAGSLGLRSEKARNPPMPHVHPWTPEQDGQLRAGWPKVQSRQTTAARLAKKMGLTVHQVRYRAAFLGLRALRYGFEPWSETEDELLGQYVHLPLRGVQKKLRAAGFKRTEAAIAIRRHRIGVMVHGNGQYYSAHELAQLMGISTITVLRWIRLGWLNATPRGDSTAGNGGPGDRWLISTGAVYRLITLHTAKIAQHLASADKVWLVDLLAGGGGAAPRAVLRQDFAGISDECSGGLDEMRIAA